MSTKREVWEQMQMHLPELAEQMQAIGKLGIAEISIETPDGKFQWRRNDKREKGKAFLVGE